jgi:3-deoxy-D-manno-octulosonic-acid transferase/heptosyltransferase-1
VHPIATCSNPLAAPPAAERILVIRLGAVGDVVRTLPAVSALRAGLPGARITWLVEPASASVVANQPWVDEVLLFPRPQLVGLLRAGRLCALARALRAFVRELRGRRFELVVDFHAILKSALLARLSGAPVRASYARPYAREGAWLLANRRARVTPRRASRFARNAALVRFLGIAAEPAAAPLRLSAGASVRVAAALGEGPAPVVIHPGTSDSTPHKRWTVGGYAQVARALAAASGAPVLVTAGPAADDRALADAIVAEAGGAARRAPPTPSLADLAALFAAARLYVGSDTGPMHVASLVGTPVVQLLGPTDPVENQPWERTPSRSVRVPVACSPCRRGCAAAVCMRVIRPEQVVAAARELLLAGPGANG